MSTLIFVVPAVQFFTFIDDNVEIVVPIQLNLTIPVEVSQSTADRMFDAITLFDNDLYERPE